MHKFKEGDRVILNPKCIVSGGYHEELRGITGTITKVHQAGYYRHWAQIIWDLKYAGSIDGLRHSSEALDFLLFAPQQALHLKGGIMNEDKLIIKPFSFSEYITVSLEENIARVLPGEDPTT
jgi:hypothetical protein